MMGMPGKKPGIMLTFSGFQLIAFANCR